MSAKNGDVGRAEQRAAALKLRSAGANYETISRHLDCSTSTAWRHVQPGCAPSKPSRRKSCASWKMPDWTPCSWRAGRRRCVALRATSTAS